MRKRILLVVLVAFSIYASLGWKNGSESQPILPDVTARGRALYEYDQAAWHATDAVQASHPSSDSVGRYIAHRSGAGWTVVFGHLNEQRDAFLIGYEATEGLNIQQFNVKKLDPPLKDMSFYLAAARAIAIALHDFKGENRPYNVAVIPASSDQLYVYVLPAQTDASVYPLGGDARYLITVDGTAIVEKRQLHKAILDVPLDPKVVKHVGGFHTHVLSDLPEDTDVFHVLTQQPPTPELIGNMKKDLYEITAAGTIYYRGKIQK